jgi:beta-N-acetylhexosaminidase
MSQLHRPVVFSIEGTELTEQEKNFVKHPLAGGVILFARNFVSRNQLTQLCQSIKQLNPVVFIAVDHEGGRVQRFKTDGFTHLPAMQKLGLLWKDNPDQARKAAIATGLVLAAELRACGVDLSFTPVLDLDYGNSMVIGDRSFGRDPKMVSVLAEALCFGLSLAGMSHCGKHFPGHGFVKADSHVAIPIDERPFDQIFKDDIQPYLHLMQGLASVMPAHVIYPNVDEHPAGFSAIWLLRILREQLGFAGSIFSDDLSMEGASIAGGYTQRAAIALAAGCDYILICNQPEATQLLFESVQTDWVESLRRFSLFIQPSQLTWQALSDLSLYQNAKHMLTQWKLIDPA